MASKNPFASKAAPKKAAAMPAGMKKAMPFGKAPAKAKAAVKVAKGGKK